MKKLKRFSQKELRWDFYPLFLNLMKKGFETESCLLMLSIWNSARFRYAVRGFNLDKFENTLKKLRPSFKKFEKLDFKTINFRDYKSDIKKIFKTLAAIKGIEKTGTPKLMHLKVPKVFVMWDTFIREHYGFNEGGTDDYFDFLEKTQNIFKNAEVLKDRTLAKLIDEHHYITITQPALEEQKKKRRKKLGK